MKANYQPLIERLCKESHQYKQRSYSQGHTEGLEDAKDVSLKDFEFIYGRTDGVDHCDYVGLSDETEYWDKQEEHRIMELPDMDSYFKGWFAGVREVWIQIKDQIK